MKILISNDDGYQAVGIHTLAAIMQAFGEITVVAPKVHQSAMSMAVSLGHKRLAYKPLPQEGPGSWHYLDATPASCVKFGLEYFYEHRNPDLVVCGINHGTNSSTAANYSATLGATEEGALNGCKAIGVSLCNFSPDADFSVVEKRLPGIIRMLLDNWPEGRYGLFYNINFPDLPDSEVKGVKFTRQGRGHWVKEFQEWDSGRLDHYSPVSFFGSRSDLPPLEEGEKGYMMIGDFVDDETDGVAEGADHSLNEEGWITITPCLLDRTDYAELERLNK
ncbi:MAG: 5'/3'-nucleotidase SurE [Bacteroidales bacterium]|nr:5'/3'-nucleotidase SurE [Bacteroidales bacterium]